MLNENIIKTMSYIETHIDKRISINNLASVAGYSEYHFIRFLSQRWDLL